MVFVIVKGFHENELGFGYPSRIIIGCNVRLNGSRTSPRISSVMTPNSGSSPGTPRITGECRSVPLRAILYSETSRMIFVPSANAMKRFRRFEAEFLPYVMRQ